MKLPLCKYPALISGAKTADWKSLHEVGSRLVDAKSLLNSRCLTYTSLALRPQRDERDSRSCTGVPQLCFSHKAHAVITIVAPVATIDPFWYHFTPKRSEDKASWIFTGFACIDPGFESSFVQTYFQIEILRFQIIDLSSVAAENRN
jgi:hypothetical protein